MEEKFLGKPVFFNKEKNILSIQFDFLTPNKLKVIEELFGEDKYISLSLKSTNRRPKTNAQLRKYFQLINDILKKLEIEPDADTVKTFDEEIKKNALRCESIIVYDKEIPIIPSKANMTVEELSRLIEYLYTVYGELLEEEINNGVLV